MKPAVGAGRLNEMGIEPEGEQVWEPGSACSAETLAARVPLSAEEHWRMVSSVSRQYVPTMFMCAGVAYLGLSLGHWSAGANQTDLKLMTIYGLAGFAMLAFGWRAKHHPPPLLWSPHIGGSAFLLVTATVALAYALGGDPSDFYLFILVQIIAGAVGHVLVKLEELRLAAERASQAKTELLANVSHEVRTPMNGVLGLSALLLDTELDEKQEKMITAIRESADALVGIVDEILDFSRLQRGQIELVSAPFDLRVLIDGVVALMQPRAEAKGLLLESETTGVTSQRFMGDSGRIRQVLLNLVNNAIKFTDSGSVHIRTEVVHRSEKARIRISVRDTGVGIPGDSLEGIFTRYQRSNPGSNRSAAGNGLGLAISKQLVDLMDGELGVSSTLDEGTCFWAEIDLGLGPETTLRVVNSEGGSQVLIREGALVLVAEDDPTSRMVTEALLKKLSCVVDIATDGREALHKAKAKEYDIVFMDCHMPLIDGFQATARLRRSADKAELPIVALTASVAEEDRLRCLDAGMNDVVCKPVRTSMLAKALERWVPLNGDRPSKSVSTLPPPPALDLGMVRQLVSLDGEDDEFIQDVLLGYVDQLRDCMKDISAALDAGDLETARLSAHRVKGASKQIGATRIGELLGGIEAEASVEGARNLLEIAEQEVPRVAAAVQGLLSRPCRAS